MTVTDSRFDARTAPCGRKSPGDRVRGDDLQGLVTEDLRYDCGCRSAKEEFHDGSVHRMVVRHDGKVVVDEEFRGE